MKQAMYRDHAEYYDLIYHWKDYEKESAEVAKLIAKYKRSPGKELLDVGCGTGKHLLYLRKQFSCTGTDVNEGILRIARQDVQGVTFVKADMQALKLGRKFDAITSLFSVIGYATSRAKLRQTIRGMADHLKPGGVLLIEPWISPDQYNAGSPHMNVYDSEDLKISRITVSKVVKELSVMDMHFLVGERAKPVLHFVDRHEMLLIAPEEILAMMEDEELAALYIPKTFTDRGMLIGVKPAGN